jgi:hypothetical protein
VHAVTYVLPVRARDPRHDLAPYLDWLAARVDDVVVVDGSATDVFDAHRDAWSERVVHVPVDADLVTPMGKVGGVLTGLRHARHRRVVVADDDVRYDEATLARVAALLDTADVVLPQNVFEEWPWHALWDTARTLVARATGGDWPGTVGLDRDTVSRAGGYAGDVMFENLELVRTVRAFGGRVVRADDVYVARRPPTTAHFVRQRVRQAYDELSRPGRLAVQLAIAPAVVLGGRRVALALAGVTIGLAELGRRRDDGARRFPARATLLAPAWTAERAVTSWLAVASRVRHGGIRYGEVTLRRAASSRRALARTVGARA